MAEDSEKDQSQQTEQPTQQRLEKARKDGQIALSKEVSHFALICSLLLIGVYLLPKTFKTLAEVMTFYLSFSSQIPIENFKTSIMQGLEKVALSFALPIGVLVLFALGIGFSQTGFVLNKKSMQPKLENVSPMKGFKKIFGVKALMEFFKNVIKLLIIIYITYLVMRPEFYKLYGITSLTISGLLTELSEQMMHFLWILMAVIGSVALLDYGYQKFMFLRNLRMSRQEIKDEFKDTEGDPHVKGKQKQLRQERSRQRMISDVPTATVVITNPTHYAVALKYEIDEMDVPVVVAKGIDAVALRIKEVAEEADVKIVENPPLARALYANLEIGDDVPTEYYEVVARVIRFVLGFDKTPPPIVELVENLKKDTKN